VNSANVTDPATGGQAVNLPIDVVSSVQVISNAYDPEYGKFTGAVSSVETRTSNSTNFTSPSKTWFHVPEIAMDPLSELELSLRAPPSPVP